jgi:hypothetical protein
MQIELQLQQIPLQLQLFIIYYIFYSEKFHNFNCLILILFYIFDYLHMTVNYNK